MVFTSLCYKLVTGNEVHFSRNAQQIEQPGWMITFKILDDKDAEPELLRDDHVSVILAKLQWRAVRAAIVLPDGSLTDDGVKHRIREEFLEQYTVHTIVRLLNSVFQPYASVAANLLFFIKSDPTKKIWYWEHHHPEGRKSYSKIKPIQKSEFAPLKSL